MKKILLCMSLVMASAFATVAYADTAEYDSTNNSVSALGIEGVKTVLVTKAGEDITGDSIYYVDQAENGSTLSVANGFAMKANPEAGTYNLILGFNELGSGTQEAQTIEFTIGEVSGDPSVMSPYGEAVTYTNSDNEEVFKIAFVTETAVDLSLYSHLSLTFGAIGSDQTVSYPIASLGIDDVIRGNVKLGIQVNNIPMEYMGTIKLAFTYSEEETVEETEEVVEEESAAAVAEVEKTVVEESEETVEETEEVVAEETAEEETEEVVTEEIIEEELVTEETVTE